MHRDTSSSGTFRSFDRKSIFIWSYTYQIQGFLEMDSYDKYNSLITFARVSHARDREY